MMAGSDKKVGMFLGSALAVVSVLASSPVAAQEPPREVSAFDSADQDGSGSLTYGEFEYVVVYEWGWSMPAASFAFQRGDMNEDGELDEAEFKKATQTQA